jgi:hypothetical protein
MTLNIFATQRALNEMTVERDGLLKKIGELETGNLNLQNMSKDYTEQIAGHNEAMTKLKAEHAKQIAELTSNKEVVIKDLEVKTEAAEVSAAAKAADIVASLGIAPETIKVSTISPAKTKLETFLAMPAGKEKTAYYQLHRTDIIRQSNEQAGLNNITNKV